MLFLLGSAIVAFHGWPQINTGPATSNVSAAPLVSSSRATRRLALVLAGPHRHAAAARAAKTVVAAAVLGRHVTRHPTVAPKGGVGTGSGGPAASGSPSSTTTSTDSAAGSSSTTRAAQCSDCNTSKPAAPVTSVVKTVSNVGTAVGNQISGFSGAVGSQLSTVSPQVGSTITTVGTTVGNTVTTTAHTAANEITTATNALGLGGGH